MTKKLTTAAIHSKRGMVTSAHPTASSIGVDILANGGSAVDAAIAANAALGFLEPMSCGVGGDLFAMLWDSSARRVYAINATGRSPKGIVANQIQLDDDGLIPSRSPASWTVPGAVDGWFELHRRFGKLPMDIILAPSIRVAEMGERVPRTIANEWAKSSLDLRYQPGFASTYLPNGRPPLIGDLFANPRLAETYRVIAKGGRDAFYCGPIAAAIVAMSKEHGGYLKADDLSMHTSAWVSPLHSTYRNVMVWQAPPSSQGITVLAMLAMVEALDPNIIDRTLPEYWHMLIEIKKRAYEDRARFLGDPDFAAVPVRELISKNRAHTLVSTLSMQEASPCMQLYPTRFDKCDTTVVVAADQDGNMISLLQSNYEDFGTGFVVDGYGFAMQNRGSQFDPYPGRPNSIMPGKRPFHTLLPSIVTREEDAWLAFGVMGGEMQPQGQVQVLINLLNFEMDLQEAGDAARVRHDGSPEPNGRQSHNAGYIGLEEGIPSDVRSGLMSRGHQVNDCEPTEFGGYQAIARDPLTGDLVGATETRKDGCAIGL